MESVVVEIVAVWIVRETPWRSRDRGTNKVQKMELIVFFLTSSTKNPLKKGTMLFEICGRVRSR